MKVQGKVAGATLDRSHGAGVCESDGTNPQNVLGFPSEELEHAVQERAENVVHQGRVVCQQISQRWGETEDPVANSRVPDDEIRQSTCSLK